MPAAAPQQKCAAGLGFLLLELETEQDNVFVKFLKGRVLFDYIQYVGRIVRGKKIQPGFQFR